MNLISPRPSRSNQMTLQLAFMSGWANKHRIFLITHHNLQLFGTVFIKFIRTQNDDVIFMQLLVILCELPNYSTLLYPHKVLSGGAVDANKSKTQKFLT